MTVLAARGPTLLRAQQWAATLTAVCAFAACAVSGELGLPLLLLFPLALAGAIAAGDRLYGRADWLWTAFLAGVLLVFGGQVFAGQLDVVVAAARFAELLLIHRLWHRRTQRDELLLLLLSLLLLCAGAALAAELTFGFAFLGYAVAGTWALALTHLRFEIESGRGPQGSAALLNSRRIATPALLGGLALLATLSLAGAALVFFTFPRMTLGGLRRAARPGASAGLSDRVDLSRQGTVVDDPRVALRVRLDPPPRGEPENLSMHWRARTLARWTGRGWRAEETGIVAATRLPTRTHAGHARMLAADVEAVAGFTDGLVLTPEGWPLSVEFRRSPTSRAVHQRLFTNAAGDLFYQPVDAAGLRYVVTVDAAEPDLRDLRGRGRQYPRWVASDLEVPPGLDPRVRALAEQLGGGKDPADAAFALESWLSGSLRYTRELAGDVPDPVADFLFSRRAGHCELFSTAMVLMLRVLGIPARNVTGYFGGRRTDAGYYAVRAGDAHSWVEAYFPGAGFVRFDPTPPSQRGSVQEGAWARLILLWDGLQQRWRALVVDYDLIAQARAVRRLGQLASDLGRRLAGKGGTEKRLPLVLGAAAALLLLSGLVVWARQRRARDFASPFPAAVALSRDQRRALRLWRKGRALLRGAGVVVDASTTPQEAARRARIAAAHELAAAWSAARWGGAGLAPARARELLRELERALS